MSIEHQNGEISQAEILAEGKKLSSEEVIKLQEIIGLSGNSVDGIFGSESTSAYIDFMKQIQGNLSMREFILVYTTLQDYFKNLSLEDIKGNLGDFFQKGSIGKIFDSAQPIRSSVENKVGNTSIDIESEPQQTKIINSSNLINLDTRRSGIVKKVFDAPQDISLANAQEHFRSIPKGFVLNTRTAYTELGIQTTYALQIVMFRELPNNTLGKIDGVFGPKFTENFTRFQGMLTNESGEAIHADGVFGNGSREAIIRHINQNNTKNEKLVLSSVFDSYMQRAENPSLSEQVILAGISKGETERLDGYDIAYENGLVPEKKITTMTILEVLAFQEKSINWQKNRNKAIEAKDRNAKTPVVSGAVGFLQVTHTTLREMIQNYNIDVRQKFDETFQKSLALIILDSIGFQEFKSSKKTMEAFLYDASGIWASLPKDVSGESFHKGDGTNVAQIKYIEAISMLQEVRRLA